MNHLYNDDFRSWCDTRETSPEVARAIWVLARNDADEADRIWDNPTTAEQISVWETVTHNGLFNPSDYRWGVGTLAEISPWPLS